MTRTNNQSIILLIPTPQPHQISQHRKGYARPNPERPLPHVDDGFEPGPRHGKHHHHHNNQQYNNCPQQQQVDSSQTFEEANRYVGKIG